MWFTLRFTTVNHILPWFTIIRIDSFWFFFCFLDEPTETEKEPKSKPNSSFPHSARTFKQPNFEFYEFEWVQPMYRYRDGCGLTISIDLGQRTNRLKYFQWWKFWKFWYSKFFRVWELWSRKWICCDFTRWKISRIWRNWGSVTRWNKRIEWIRSDSRNARPFFWRWSCCWGYF